MYCKSCGAAVIGRYCSCCGARVRTDVEDIRLRFNRMRRAFLSEKTTQSDMASRKIAEACWDAGCVKYGFPYECSMDDCEERILKIDRFARLVFSLIIVAVTAKEREWQDSN